MSAPPTTKPVSRKMRFAVHRGYRSILIIKDDPRRIAWGVAIGTFVAYLPIVGIQMIVGAIACKLMRANVLASLPLAWITNPLTMGPIYFLLFLLGGMFTGDSMSYADMEAIVTQIMDAGIFSLAGLETTIGLIGSIFWPMLIGGVIVGAINAAIFYYLILKLVRSRQQRQHQRKHMWKKKTERLHNVNVHLNDKDIIKEAASERQPSDQGDESLAPAASDSKNGRDETQQKLDNDNSSKKPTRPHN